MAETKNETNNIETPGAESTVEDIAILEEAVATTIGSPGTPK